MEFNKLIKNIIRKTNYNFSRVPFSAQATNVQNTKFTTTYNCLKRERIPPFSFNTKDPAEVSVAIFHYTFKNI